MSNTPSRPSNFSRELVTGLNGSGHKVWIVLSTWTRVDGRKGHKSERFTNKAEALNWLKWA